jgi:hypothetical protein
MLASDIIHLPYTPDLTEGGISYACRSLALTPPWLGASPLDHLRNSVTGAVVELAFRRYLSKQKIPFTILGAEPFTHPNNYDVSLGGHRCDVKSYLISRRPQITRLRHDLGLVLQAPALVPLDEFAAEGHKPDDLYMFAFLLGLTATTRKDLDKALAAGQPVYLIHPLSDRWARPANWLPFEELTLKSESDTPIIVELGGQDAERKFITTALELPPRMPFPVGQTFYSLAYVHTAHQPAARIGLHSPRCGEAYVIQASDWGNLWIYGLDILLTGWLTHEEFHRKASVMNPGRGTFQYTCTRVKNLSVLITNLDPLLPLLEKIKASTGIRFV